jgi:hypothetical protein
MSAQEFALWLQLYADEPWGEDRADLRAGIIAATVANHAGRMRSESASPVEFMPYARREDTVTEEPDPLRFFSAL